MERKLANFKKGLIPREERLRMASEFASGEDLKHIDETILEIEACEMAKRYARYHVPVLGDLARDRPAGHLRWMYCQLNGALAEDSKTRKSSEILALARKWEVQGVAIAEHGNNFSCVPSSRRLASWFQDKQKVRANEAWNVWPGEHAGNSLQGGTGLIAFEGVFDLIKKSNNDFRKLGRWSS